MIRTIKVKNHDRIAEAVLSLTNPWDTGLAITKIDGLGPPKATINTMELANQSGSIYNSSRMTTRNITISFMILDVIQNGGVTKTIEEVRGDAYKVFTPMTKITLTIVTDLKTYMTDGYVESCEPDIFSKNESLNVSIICPEPYLYEKSETISITSGIYEDLFEFPFSNESLSNSLINMGNILESTSSDSKIINYLGDVPTGFSLVIHYNSSPRGIGLNIQNGTTDKQLKIDWSRSSFTPFQGSDLVISTIVGMKGIWLLNTSLLYCVSSNADWFPLVPGRNIILISEILKENNQETYYPLSNATATIDVLNRYVGL